MKLRVHPSISHAQAMLASVPKRIGRSLTEWANLLVAAPDEPKALIRHLRQQYGLGGPTAMVIAYSSLGITDEFDADAYLRAAPKKVDQQYAAKKAHLRPIADMLFEIIAGLGPDVAASPCKTYVPFYRQHVFAQVKAATQKRIDVGLALGRYSDEIPNRLRATGGKEKGDRITHVIAVTTLDEIDAELISWVRIAYELDE